MRKTFDNLMSSSTRFIVVAILATSALFIPQVCQAQAPPYLLQWGSFGFDYGQFQQPFGIAVDGSDLVYVGDSRIRRIQIFDGAGTFQRSWNTAIVADYVVIDKDFGSVYIGNGNPTLFKYSIDGTLLNQWVADVEVGAAGMAIGPNHNLYVCDHVGNRVLVYSSDGVLLNSWGSTGEGDGQLTFPSSISIDGDGNVLVADYRRVQKFNATGTYLATLVTGKTTSEQNIMCDGSSGFYMTNPWDNYVRHYTAAGQMESEWTSLYQGGPNLNQPIFMAVDSQKHLYLTEGDGVRIDKFSQRSLEPPPPFVMKWGAPGSACYGVTTSVSGKVFVTDITDNTVRTFSQYGGLLKTFGQDELSHPSGVAVDATGNTYVADTFHDRVLKYSDSGTFIGPFGGGLSQPWGVAVDESGNVYVADTGNNLIKRFDQNGTLIDQWGGYGSGDKQFNTPRCVAVHGDKVYVGDTANQRVQRLSNTGDYETQWPINPSGPTSLGVDAGGNVYVGVYAPFTGGRFIQAFSSEGVPLSQWGDYGTGDGQFSGTGGIAFDNLGNVYAADAVLNRIQKFGPGPGLPPILFVHGVCSNEGMWDAADFKQAFIGAGFAVYSFSYDNRARPQDDVAALAKELDKIPGNSVVVIAHSMGGLVAREYIARSADCALEPSFCLRNKISTLITLGTPHHGSEIARFARLVHSGLGLVLGSRFSFIEDIVCQLSAPALKDLSPSSRFLNGLNYGANKDYYDHDFLTTGNHDPEDLRDARIRYFTISGTGGLCEGIDGLARASIWIDVSHTNDGAVTTGSSQLYQLESSPFDSRSWTDTGLGLGTLSHASGPGIVFCNNSYVESPDLRGTVINILRGVIPPPQNTAPQFAMRSMANAGPTPSDLPVMNGWVGAGQVDERPLNVPNAAELRVTLVASGAHLELRKPDGDLLTVADTASVVGLRFIDEQVDTLEAMVLANPTPGLWHVVVDAGTSGSQEYGVIPGITSGFTTQLEPTERLLYPGQTTVVRGSVDSAGLPLANVTWACSVMAPDSVVSNLTLYDDGAHADGLASDGIFGNTFSPSGPIGFYDLTAKATMLDGVTMVTGSNVELAPANDLAVLSSEIVLSQNVVAAGDSVLVLATIRNNSTVGVAGAEVSVWDDRTGVRLDSLTVDLPAGGHVGIASLWKVAAPDTHLVRVTVSPFTLSSEISYTNNSGFKQVVLGVPTDAVGPNSGRVVLELAPPLPNPSTNHTILRFSLPQPSNASLTIYDVLGRKIKQWRWTNLSAGAHRVPWDGRTESGQVVPPSVLFYRLDVGSQHLRQKFIHLQ